MKKYLPALVLIIVVFAAIKFSVEKKRATWDRVNVTIVDTDERQETRGRKNISISVCTYHIEYEYKGEHFKRAITLDTSCYKNSGVGVLLISPHNPSSVELDFGLEPVE